MNKYAASALVAILLLAGVQSGCTKQETTSENQSRAQSHSEQAASEMQPQQQEKESPMSAQYRSLTPFGRGRGWGHR